MEKDIFKLSSDNEPKKETLCTSTDDSRSNGNLSKTPPKKKEVNSWDCSTPTNNEKASKKKVSDWDSSSECQETAVEPFDSNENPKDCDNWDSESEKNSPKSEAKEARPFLDSSTDSFNISIADLSDLEKSSLMEMMGSERAGNGGTAHEDLLLVEDLEEFLRSDNTPKTSKEFVHKRTEDFPKNPGGSDLGTDSEKVRSNHSEGTREDTTIWMIPKSERTQSGESTSKLISSSDKEKIEKLTVLKNFLKKTKSLSDVQKSKIRRRTARSSRSDNLINQKNNYNSSLMTEGLHRQWKLEIESKNTKEKISGRENIDRSSVFFTEYECRAMTVEKDTPEKQSVASNSVTNSTNTLPEPLDAGSDGTQPQALQERNPQRSSETEVSEIARAGTSENACLDVMSLPDMTRRAGLQEQQKAAHRLNMSDTLRPDELQPMSTTPEDSRMSESWFLLDSTGRYQPVTLNEVTILLNGRSAEAVLQDRKEHFIPKSTLLDTKSLQDSLNCIQSKESFQNLLKEEDTGGEDEGRKSIDLERKVENTLFYIQPNMNFTASIRIIPVESEMIHIWRRTRGSGSLLSSEVDLSHPSLDSVETVAQKPPDQNPSAGRRLEHSVPENPEQGFSPFLDRAMNHTPFFDRAMNSPFFDRGINNSPFLDRTINSPFFDRTIDNSSFADNTLGEHSLHHSRATVDYSRLLMETRTIVDSLSDNFKTIQKRLDGETNRSVALQGEVDDLKLFLKKFEGKFPEKNSREIISDIPLTTVPDTSIQSLKEKSDVRSTSILEECEDNSENLDPDNQREAKNLQIVTESRSQNTDDLNSHWNDDSNIITVNIYTVDSNLPIPRLGETQETYSIVQSNLTMIENKMRRLQQENEILMKQNVNLKRKLREISMELEKYLASTSHPDSSDDDGRELDMLRDQVCNLKLELENLKNKARIREEDLTEENLLIQKEFTKIVFSLKDWCVMAGNVFERIETAKNRLQESGITMDVNLEEKTIQNPKNFSNFLNCFIEKTVSCLLAFQEEHNFYEKALKENLEKDMSPSKKISGLDEVIKGYGELINQCRKGQAAGDGESKVIEDYFAVIVEKASLMEEIKILKTENEMLLESQMEHYEKLKQTMIALKDRKNDIVALETSQKLSDDERAKMVDMLKLYEIEKQEMEVEMSKKNKTIDDLIEEMERKQSEISNCNERLKAAVEEISNFEKSCRLKDELISEMKKENDGLFNVEKVKNGQIEILKEEIQKLEIRGTQLEAELASTKLFLNESQKEMTDYITHLESLVNNSQDSIEKTKQKLKESHQTINRLKSENEVLDKQHECDLKLFNATRDELDACKENLLKANTKLKELEEDREKLLEKFASLSDCEKEKSQALEILAKEYKNVVSENGDLKERLDVCSKDKEESLKEQKDLINKYAILSKGLQKLQKKYRSVKYECNQRTDLIKYLEMMLKENLVEYNSRIACLEQNISRIIEKIVACQNGIKEKHFGVDEEVRELRHQLEVTYQERKELENVIENYYSMMKHLENEIQEREKKVDELHAKLSLEQQRTVESDAGKRLCQDLPQTPPRCDYVRVEHLENQVEVLENELVECKKELQHCQTSYDNEKKKLELTIADLKSEVKRYQLRIEVMMRNLTNKQNANGLITEKSKVESTDEQTLTKELQQKNKLITELTEEINKYKAEVKLKDSDLENSKKKSFYLDEELKNLQNKIAKMQGEMFATNKASEMQQKERDEMAEKLFQSVKLIMEERSTRQTLESLAVEKEKNYKNQIDQIKNELGSKVKECATLTAALEDKKKVVLKLQSDLKKTKSEILSLKEQVNRHRGSGDGVIGEDQVLNTSEFLNHLKTQNASPERLESCLKELKEIRDLNLQLRKAEGQYQAQIVRLEDEIRDSRLLIKELQGDIKTEKKSKKAFKNMIVAAKMEIEKCLLANQLMSVVAERISRHLDLSEIPSRELLSGFRLSDSSSSSKACAK